MPSAQLHFPFEHEDLFERRFPADFICEAIDQTRGWFYSLLAVNTLVFDRTPYRNVVCLALVLDKDGQKMSKSRGNVIDPWSILDTRGADALRWNFFSAGSPWTPKRVYEESIDESTRRFLLTLWNTFSFFVTYANLDGWQPTGGCPPARTCSTAGSGRASTPPSPRSPRPSTGSTRCGGAQALERLVDDLSNWYVRRSRPRFWKATDPAAHATLHECLVTVSELLAPFCPFLTDEVHRVLLAPAAPGSVHLADWPAPDLEAIDEALEAEMALARLLVSLGRAARTDARIRVRQPLPRALVLLGEGEHLSPEVVAEVAEELNVKRVEQVSTLEGLLAYAVVPNFRALGPRLGKRLPRVKELLAEADGAAVRRALDEHGVFVLDVDGEPVELGPAELEVRARHHEELALAQDGPRAVALDLTLDDALRAEGLARELVRALNDHRKATGLEIADRIRLSVWATGPVADALARHGDWVAGEVLAVDWALHQDPPPSGAPTLEVEGELVGLRVEVA
ncbi:MAG: DUF5915 domain-containing protein [Acidimicrobiia bacterium]|nr:DUF5915 domain-containing protein [Acidimicrobiia bacterium]